MPKFVDGSGVPKAVAPKCARSRKALPGAPIDLEATGSRDNNAMVSVSRTRARPEVILLAHWFSVPGLMQCLTYLRADWSPATTIHRSMCPGLQVKFLQCESKARKLCDTALKSYEKCHGAVMGTGQYNGRRDCGSELEALFDCVFEHRSTSA